MSEYKCECCGVELIEGHRYRLCWFCEYTSSTRLDGPNEEISVIGNNKHWLEEPVKAEKADPGPENETDLSALEKRVVRLEEIIAGYETFFNSDAEIIVGLPIPDEDENPQMKGWYGWAEVGFANTEETRVVIEQPEDDEDGVVRTGTFKDQGFCGGLCQRHTILEYYCSGHERDSSGDTITCLTCGSVQYGMSGKWQKP
jgi:hypothetical protein